VTRHLAWLCLLACGLTGCGGGNRIEGAGSSFVDPIMQQWTDVYYEQGGAPVNYQAKGSSAGIDLMIRGDVDFGCSEVPLSTAQLDRARAVGGDVLQVPLCLGAVVIAYNLPDLPETTRVNFSGEVLAAIYLGKITRWNDPELQALQPPGVQLPAQDIVPVRRSDGSGSTYVFTHFLHKVVQDDWTPGVGTTVEWPVGNGQKGTDGVAGFVQRTPGALGYVELLYADNNHIPYGTVRNAAGKDIGPTPQSVAAAAAAARAPDDLRDPTFAPAADAYPIATTVWAALFVRQPPHKADKLRAFLRWVVHEGQDQTEQLHYARLPVALVARIDSELARIEAIR
jgi:phosphate transport system substrate-binding protein